MPSLFRSLRRFRCGNREKRRAAGYCPRPKLTYSRAKDRRLGNGARKMARLRIAKARPSLCAKSVKSSTVH